MQRDGAEARSRHAAGGGDRRPVFAGRFYPLDPVACDRLADQYLRPESPENVGRDGASGASDGVGSPVGGIVPHAGWVCSGAVAGRTIAALAAARPDAEVIVIFGAIHTSSGGDVAGLDDYDRWLAPGGGVAVSAALRRSLLERPGDAAIDVLPRLHAREHAVEVELPLVRRARPGAALLPIEVPPTHGAPAVGAAVAAAIASLGLRAVYLASSDLTHYGPSYDFAPAGVGPAGLAWARDNDRRLLDLVTAGAAERVVPEVRARRNACGGGEVAAMLAACRAIGARAGRVILQTDSSQTCGALRDEPADDAVGYAAVVVG